MGEIQGIGKTHKGRTDALNKGGATPNETLQEKLNKTNIFDYAKIQAAVNIQAGAYMG